MTPQQKKRKQQNKCDRIIQEIGRETYKNCYVCGGVYSCLHHFIPKSRSNKLRYDWENLIPICSHCHSLHHQYKDSTIHAKIQLKKGEEWAKSLIKKQQEIVQTTLGYYKKIYENLKKLT